MNMPNSDNRRVPIPAVERQRRQRAVNFARGSIGLEGFTLTATDEDRARRFIGGEIDLAEFMKALPIDPLAYEREPF
ncbi:antitoxin VbhA family protein [Paraburkholderia sp. BR14320]|uniref:antitoxin VbhA family protein n=1 Tax=unclassified Paraburkholderia TaxID=2615204 RepID=UPI0034CD7071